ncbi:MAG: MFS transporter [Pseudomonadota bacterium]
MRSLFTRAVGVPLATIFACQAVLTMGAYSLPVIIPIAAPDLDVEPESVGFLVAVLYASAMMVGLTSGELLARLGPTRVFQLLLVLVGLGAAVLDLAFTGVAVLAAMFTGAASGPMNPTGSYVLSRVAGPEIRALVFSLKQCGTPLGGMMAGVMLPPLMLAAGWQTAVLAIPTIAAMLLLLVPFGGLGGPPPAATTRHSTIMDSVRALRLIWDDAGLRAVTLSGFGLSVCQMGLATYLVVYLWQEVGYSPEQAGLVFASLHMSGIVSRVVLGVIADRLIATRWVLVWLGIILSGAFGLILLLDSSWPLAGVYVVMAIAGASGNGWVGLYFAELARLSPPERVAEIAAGSQFVTYLGIVCGPILFATLLKTLNSYQACFVLFGLLALTSGLYLAAARIDVRYRAG